MGKFNSLSKVARSAGKLIRKHAPEILVGSGIVGTIVSTVMACKATTKADDILNEFNTEIDKIHKVSEDKTVNYTEKDIRKDTAIVYGKTAIKFVKLYGKSVGLGILSITSILGGHKILKGRNIALAAAYTTIDKGFKEYRDRVIERFGDEVDKELKYNIKNQKIDEKVVDPETGKEKKVKKTIGVSNLNENSDYARFFDDRAAGWCSDPEFNLTFLRLQQDYANELLQKRGYVFLNDVYNMLGIPATKAGQIVGWVYKEDDENHKGDNFIDFGIYNLDDERKRAFVNGLEKAILLDFNVDGNILDLI